MPVEKTSVWLSQQAEMFTLAELESLAFTDAGLKTSQIGSGLRQSEQTMELVASLKTDRSGMCRQGNITQVSQTLLESR